MDPAGSPRSCGIFSCFNGIFLKTHLFGKKARMRLVDAGAGGGAVAADQRGGGGVAGRRRRRVPAETVRFGHGRTQTVAVVTQTVKRFHLLTNKPIR